MTNQDDIDILKIVAQQPKLAGDNNNFLVLKLWEAFIYGVHENCV